MQGDDFWGDGTNSAPHHPAPSSVLPRRSLFSFLRPSSRIATTSQAITRQPRPWNIVSLFNRISVQTVAAARDEDVSSSSSPTYSNINTNSRDTASPLRPRQRWLQPWKKRTKVRPTPRRHQVEVHLDEHRPLRDRITFLIQENHYML